MLLLFSTSLLLLLNDHMRTAVEVLPKSNANLASTVHHKCLGLTKEKIKTTKIFLPLEVRQKRRKASKLSASEMDYILHKLLYISAEPVEAE